MPPTEAIVSVDPGRRFGESGANRLVEGMLDRHTEAIRSGWLEYEKTGGGESDGRTELVRRVLAGLPSGEGDAGAKGALELADVHRPAVGDHLTGGVELEAGVAGGAAAIGALAGSIAHDFNNLLVGVLSNAELALQTLAGDAPSEARRATICARCRRCRAAASCA